MLFKSFFEQLPHELFEAAYVDGCGYIGFFFRFTLPLSTPILATVGTFVFVQSWNNYLLPLVVINNRELFTWPLGMMQFRGEYIVEWNKILAFVSLTIFPAIVFFIAAQKYIVAGLTRGSVKNWGHDIHHTNHQQPHPQGLQRRPVDRACRRRLLHRHVDLRVVSAYRSITRAILCIGGSRRARSHAAQLDLRGNPDSCGVWAPRA